MIGSFGQVERLFEELDKATCKGITVYIIGGVPLLRRGMKAATKDIDIVVATKEEFQKAHSALERIGFSTKTPGRRYTHMNLSQIFQRGDFRIDLFQEEVCGRFSLSENMKKRAEKVIDLDHITVFLCSNEDIFLFKTMTERAGDIADCMSIASTQNPDWNIILEELQGQIRQSKQDIWITWVGERLDVLAEMGVDMPIMDEVNRLREKFFEDFEKRHPSWK